ncbi:MAG: anti-sigma factor family protein [Kiloniellaceae bacterium]
MTDRTPPVTENDLHVYVDGRLDPARAAAVEAHLAAHPEDAERIAAYRRQNELLRAAFAELSAEPAPARLFAAARGSPGGWRAPARGAIAAALLLAVGLGAGWTLRGVVAPPPAETAGLARLASAAHRVYTVEVRHPVEVRAEEEHLVRWLSKRVGEPLTAPDLSPFGFSLVGGRLLPAVRGGAAAQFMYEDAAGRRITCYITANREGGETAFRFVSEDGLSAFYWLDRRLGYVLVGEMDRGDLLELSRAVYRQLTP